MGTSSLIFTRIKLVHNGIARVNSSTHRAIKLVRRYVSFIGQNPGGPTIQFATKAQEFFQNGFRDSLFLMSWRYTHFIDPQFFRLIGMDVVDSGSKPDDHAILDGNHDMMAQVGKKFRL